MTARMYRLYIALFSALFSILLVNCTQTLKLPTKKAADIPAETDAEKQLIDRAKQYFNDKHIDSAITTFKKVLEINPLNIRANYYLAKSYLRKGNHNDCFKHCQAGLDYEGDYYQHFAACLGECYIAMDRARSAISMLSQADKLYPNNDKILFQLGKAYNLDRSYALAEWPLAVSIMLNPYFPEAHLELAKTYKFMRVTTYQVYPILAYLSLENNENYLFDAQQTLNNAYIQFYIRNDSLIFSSHEINFGFLSGFLIRKTKTGNIPGLSEVAKRSPFGKTIEKTTYLLDFIYRVYTQDYNIYKEEMLFRVYFKYLSDVYKAGLAEVFTYYIYSQSGIEEVEKWLKNNQDKVDAFRKWVQEYNWDI